MTAYRFRIQDPMNEWFRAIEVDAPDAETAQRRAEHMLFARREVGANGLTVTPEPTP